MCFMSGKTLVEMVFPRNTSLPQNNALENEQPGSSMVGTTEYTNPIGTNALVLNLIVSTTLMPGVVVAFPVATSILTTPRPTSAPLMDPSHSYLPSFTMTSV